MAASPTCEEEAPAWKIPGTTLHGRVHSVYSPRNDLLVYGVSKSSFNLHEISPTIALHNSCIRKLVNESHEVFLSLNMTAQDLPDNRRAQEISRVSQRYRTLILVCVQDLDCIIEETGDEDLINQRNMLADIELVWNLLQSLIIDVQSGNRVLHKLLDWIKWHFFVEVESNEIKVAKDPHLHPQYWDTIFQLILQGKTESARLYLSMHTHRGRQDFKSLDELLHKMPTYGAHIGISLNEFRIRWKMWQEECRSRLKEGEFVGEPGLETACKILCGDQDTLTEKSSLCSSWYQLMVCVLLYTDPCISLSGLGDAAKAYYSNVHTKKTAVDAIILAALELDIATVIRYSCLFDDGLWFAAHITDLLCHGRYIQPELPVNREFLLLHYADTLMTHSSLWQVGIDYLDHCRETGRDMLEVHLERIPLETESKARKILYLAKQRNLDHLVKTISNVMTSRAVANGQLGTALSWIVHSKDMRFATELANRLLQDYIERRKFECFEILNNMGSCIFFSDKLTFVGKYCEFHKLYNAGDYEKAASLLVSLISSGIAPINFQTVMMLDALPLLEAPNLIFSSEDTYLLMTCLEEIARYGTKNEEPLDGDQKENLIRLALVRNLGRSFVTEAFDPQDAAKLPF